MEMVFVAVRNERVGATVGYFPTSELPTGWALANPPQQDISDVMHSMNSSMELTLQVMNAHWQK